MISQNNPGKWIIFNQYVLKDPKISYIKDNTLIINQYLLTKGKVNIVYEILKLFKNNKIIMKVINEKEFLVAHFKNQEMLMECIDDGLWKLYKMKEFYYSHYEIKLKVNRKEHLLYNKDIRLKLTDSLIDNVKNGKKYYYSYNDLVLIDVLNKILRDL